MNSQEYENVCMLIWNDILWMCDYESVVVFVYKAIFFIMFEDMLVKIHECVRVCLNVHVSVCGHVNEWTCSSGWECHCVWMVCCVNVWLCDGVWEYYQCVWMCKGDLWRCVGVLSVGVSGSVCVLPIYGHRLRRPGHHREEPYEAFLSKNISASRQIIERKNMPACFLTSSW